MLFVVTFKRPKLMIDNYAGWIVSKIIMVLYGKSRHILIYLDSFVGMAFVVSAS